MERFLLSNGIDKSKIIKEEKSTSTAENFKHRREILSKMDSRKEIHITVVTTNFHMFRAKFLEKGVGFRWGRFSKIIKQ